MDPFFWIRNCFRLNWLNFQVLGQPLYTASKQCLSPQLPIPGFAEKPIGSLVVVAPQGPDLVLASHVPDGEGEVLVLHSLHVESDGWNGGDNFTSWITWLEWKMVVTREDVRCETGNLSVAIVVEWGLSHYQWGGYVRIYHIHIYVYKYTYHIQR